MWRPLTTSDVQFTPAETTMLQTIQGASSGLASKLNIVVNEFVGAMSAAGYPVSQGKMPDQLRRHATALAIWTWLRDFPRLTAFKTDERKQAAADAEKIYEKICNRTYGAIESPTGTDTTTANWDSLPKVLGRMAAVPPPNQQLQALPTPLYANPNAPSDVVPTNSPMVLQPPNGFMVQSGNGQVMVVWNTMEGADSYNLYRSTSPGQETLFKSGLTNTYFLDTGLANGTNYFYRVSAVNSVGNSPLAQEIAGLPQSTNVN